MKKVSLYLSGIYQFKQEIAVLLAYRLPSDKDLKLLDALRSGVYHRNQILNSITSQML
jgi:hypothetical protein